MSPLVRQSLIGAALGLALLGAVYVRARRESNRWWTRAERLCGCNGPAIVSLHALTPVPMGGLDRVADAQARSLSEGCNDLRVAVARRSLVENLRGSGLRVRPTAEHQRTQREVARSLGLMCGEEHQVFWRDLRAHHERIRTAPDDTPREIVRVSAEAMRVRDAMCARRAVLGGPPMGYELSAADADRQGRTCAE